VYTHGLSQAGVFNGLDKSQLRKKPPGAAGLSTLDRLQRANRPAAASGPAAAANLSGAAPAGAGGSGALLTPPLNSATSLAELLASSSTPPAPQQPIDLALVCEASAVVDASGGLGAPASAGGASGGAPAGRNDAPSSSVPADGVHGSIPGSGVQGDGASARVACLGKDDSRSGSAMPGGTREGDGSARGGAASRGERRGVSGRQGDAAPSSRPLHGTKAGAGT